MIPTAVDVHLLGLLSTQHPRVQNSPAAHVPPTFRGQHAVQIRHLGRHDLRYRLLILQRSYVDLRLHAYTEILEAR